MVSFLRPHVTVAMLTADMKESYGLTVSEIKELQSYDDAMFLITTDGMSVIVCQGIVLWSIELLIRNT